MQEYKTYAHALNGCTQYARHEGIALHYLWQMAARVDVGKHVGVRLTKMNHDFLHNAQQEGEHEHSVDGFKAKTPTQHLDGHAQQQDIDGIKVYCTGNSVA